MREGISFGMSHCCACSQVCYHIGPIQLCEEHRRQAPDAVVTYSDRERRLIESYESKVQDLARETLRNSELQAELTTLRASLATSRRDVLREISVEMTAMGNRRGWSSAVHSAVLYVIRSLSAEGGEE